MISSAKDWLLVEEGIGELRRRQEQSQHYHASLDRAICLFEANMKAKKHLLAKDEPGGDQLFKELAQTERDFQQMIKQARRLSYLGCGSAPSPNLLRSLE